MKRLANIRTLGMSAVALTAAAVLLNVKVIEDLLNYIINHWQNLSIQTLGMAGAAIIAKNVGVKKVRRILSESYPKIFKEDNDVIDVVARQTEAMKEMQQELILLRRTLKESNQYVERNVREIQNKLSQRS